MLDMAALSRKAAAAVAVSSGVRDELDKAENEVSFTIRLMFLGGAIEPNSAEKGLERPLRVSVGRLQQVGLDADEQKRWQAGTFGAGEYRRKVSAGQMSLTVAAVAKGCGSVAISVWDGAGIRPLDHLIYDFQVGSDHTCPTEGRLQAGAEFALSIASRADPKGAQEADAVFHIFEVNPNARDEGSIVWFVDRRALAKARATGRSGGVYAWRTESSIQEYVEKETQLPMQIADARTAAVDAPPGAKASPYADVAATLRRKLFTARMPDVYGNIALEADSAMARLINESEGKAVVLARHAVAVDALRYIPLGLLSARSEQPFLNKPFVTVQPLPRERFHGGKVCIDPWTLGIPSVLKGLDDKVEAELKNFSAGEQEPLSRFGFARTIQALGERLNKSTAARESRAEGIVVLSHHADGQLWFDDVPARLDSESLRRPFRPGSIALLSACSAGGSGALAFKLIDKLNRLNVDSMIVTPFPVNADFGTLLALNFIRQVRAAHDNNQTPTIADLYVQAWEATAAWFKKQGKDFYEMGLEFVLLGDPSIRLCAD
ncbi:hypothetical protein [Acidovorax sp. Q11]